MLKLSCLRENFDAVEGSSNLHQIVAILMSFTYAELVAATHEDSRRDHREKRRTAYRPKPKKYTVIYIHLVLFY